MIYTLYYFFSFSILVLLSNCAESPTSEKQIKNESEHPSITRKQVQDLMKIQDIKGTTPWFSYGKGIAYDTHTEYRFEYESNSQKVPGFLLIPKNIEPPYPVMICLQGHAPGMYISMGKYHNEKEKRLVEGGRDLAVQALENGWAALVLEQKGFGERRMNNLSCNHQSLREILKGRTMLGQRVYDIIRVLDVIEAQDSLNNRKIGIIGNSSGGTTGYYAAAMDQRIDLTIVSCSFATFESSWLKYPHCACGYLPSLLEVADMPDLTALIAPRNLIIVAGREDYLADLEGVKEGFVTAQKWYNKLNAPENLRLIIGDGGHQFYPEKTWPVIQEMKQHLNP